MPEAGSKLDSPENTPSPINPFASIRIADGFSISEASERRLNVFLDGCGLFDQWGRSLPKPDALPLSHAGGSVDSAEARSENLTTIAHAVEDADKLIHIHGLMAEILFVDELSHIPTPDAISISAHSDRLAEDFRMYHGDTTVDWLNLPWDQKLEELSDAMTAKLSGYIKVARKKFELPETTKNEGQGRLFLSDTDTNFFYKINGVVLHDYKTKLNSVIAYGGLVLSNTEDLDPQEAIQSINRSMQDIPALHANNKNMLACNVEPLAAENVFKVIAEEIQPIAIYKGMDIQVSIEGMNIPEGAQETRYSPAIAASYGRNVRENIENIIDDMIKEGSLQSNKKGLHVSLSAAIVDGQLAIINTHNIRPYSRGFTGFAKGKSVYKTQEVQKRGTGLAMYSHDTIAKSIVVGDIHGSLTSSNKEVVDGYGNVIETLAVTTLKLPVLSSG